LEITVIKFFTMSSMITTTAWVRRGVAAQFPTKYEIDEEEMNRISKLARMQLEDAKEDMSAAQGEDSAMDEDKKDEDVMEDAEEKEPSKEGAEAKSTEYVQRN
jgi:periodic tryptophan protein 1